MTLSLFLVHQKASIHNMHLETGFSLNTLGVDRKQNSYKSGQKTCSTACSDEMLAGNLLVSGSHLEWSFEP